jgi:hypothetical protein
MLASAADIKVASRELCDWLSDGAFLPTDPAQALEQPRAIEVETLVDLFVEIAKKRGFSLGIASINGHFIARWSHTSIRTARIHSMPRTTTMKHAKLLACAALLRDAECSAQVAAV